MSASPGLSNYSNETVFRRKKEKVGKSCFGHIANNAYNVIIMYLVTAQHCMVYIQHFDLKKKPWRVGLETTEGNIMMCFRLCGVTCLCTLKNATQVYVPSDSTDGLML